MNALRGTNPRLLAYLTYMVERLLPMRGILKPTGSIYLHCDPTASHYIKVMMDAIFDHKNFKNEIIWSYRRWPTKARKYQSMHDVILFYAMSGHNTFNVGYEPPSESTMKRFKGKRHKRDLKAKRNIYLDEPIKGLPMRDVWTLPVIAAVAKERMGYSTQKPLALLNRIIETSTNEGDVVFDPFCGVRHDLRGRAPAGATLDRDRHCNPCREACRARALAGSARACRGDGLRGSRRTSQRGRRA